RLAPSADGSFTITETGTYTVLGEGLNPEDNLCPVEKTMEVDLEESIDFELIEPAFSCEGPFTYEVDLLGRDPETVSIQWLDENGQRAGNGLTFTPASPGDYTVEVLPAGAVNCADGEQNFTVPEIAAPVQVDLNTT